MLKVHVALPDGYGDTMKNMASRAEHLAQYATVTDREKRILADMARQLRHMAG